MTTSTTTIVTMSLKSICLRRSSTKATVIVVLSRFHLHHSGHHSVDRPRSKTFSVLDDFFYGKLICIGLLLPCFVFAVVIVIVSHCDTHSAHILHTDIVRHYCTAM